MHKRQRPGPTRVRSRSSRPRLEWLEDRTAPALITLPGGDQDQATVAFDAASGLLSILGGAGVAAQVEVDANAVAVTVDGRLHSGDPASPSYDPALAAADGGSLRGIRLVGGAADALTL